MESLITSSGLFLIVLIFLGLVVFLYFIPVGLWVTAFFSGVRVKLVRDLMGMRLRKVPPAHIVKPLITAHKAGIFHHDLLMALDSTRSPELFWTTELLFSSNTLMAIIVIASLYFFYCSRRADEPQTDSGE